MIVSVSSYFLRALMVVVGAACGVFNCSAVNFPLHWRWSNPTPHGNNIIDVAYTNQFWIQVAERGQIYTSGDGISWTPRDSQTTRSLRGVTFFKDQIVVVGENGTVITGPSASDFRLVEVGTSDWLESVAASSQLAVAVGDNAAIYTSSDAVQWQRQNVPFSDWLRSVAYGTPEGIGTFCAVGEGGLVATSTNGVQWEAQARLTSIDLNRVSWFNGEFWIVGAGGAVFQSSSAKAWLSSPTGASEDLNAFAGQDARRLVAGETEVRVRTGRANWVDQLSPAQPFPPPVWTYLSAAAETNSFLLCGRTGMIVEGFMTSNNELAWLPISESLRNWLWDVKRFPNLYLAVGDRATLLSSVDGINWAVELPPDAATNSVFLGIGGKTNVAVAVGNSGSIITSVEGFETVISTNSSGTLITNEVSTLGIYWTAVQPRPTTNDLQGITVFNDRFVVSGGGGNILTSSNGASWTRQNSTTSEFLSSVEAFPGGVVAVGRKGTILSSPDAVTWTSRGPGGADWIYRVRFAGNKLVAVGQNGKILTSADGIDWTLRQSGSTQWLNDVHWIGDTYFAIGNQGAVLSSPDAATWTERGTITGKSLFAAASHAGMLVTVGVEGVILRSQVVPFDTPVNFLRFPRSVDEGVFLFSGQPGQRFTLDRSTNLTTWTRGMTLEIDPSGTLLFLDGSSNSMPDQFYRANPIP